MTLTAGDAPTVADAITDAEALDDACVAMLPIARKFTAAVRGRNPQDVADAFAAVYDFEAPDGRHPLAVLVLADEVLHLRRATGSVLAERERCRQLAANVAHAPTGAVISQARTLPKLIAQGVRP